MYTKGVLTKTIKYEPLSLLRDFYFNSLQTRAVENWTAFCFVVVVEIYSDKSWNQNAEAETKSHSHLSSTVSLEKCSQMH